MNRLLIVKMTLKMLLTTCLLLSVFVTTALCETYSFDALTRSVVVGQRNCTEMGPICSDCKTVSFCNRIGDNDFFATNMSTCADDQTCSSDISDCTTKDNPECEAAIDSSGFICYSLGVYPDPYKCTVYHLCVPDGAKINPKSTMITCPTNFGFDPVTSTCRINLAANGGKCLQTAVPIKCTNGTKAVSPLDPTLYYWCMKDAKGLYYPQIFRCTKNQQFLDGACRELPLAPPLTGTCTQKLRYSDPNDCRVYFDCAGPNYRPSRQVCPSNRRFVYQEQNCVDFTCAPTLTNTGLCKL